MCTCLTQCVIPDLCVITDICLTPCVITVPCNHWCMSDTLCHHWPVSSDMSDLCLFYTVCHPWHLIVSETMCHHRPVCVSQCAITDLFVLHSVSSLTYVCLTQCALLCLKQCVITDLCVSDTVCPHWPVWSLTWVPDTVCPHWPVCVWHSVSSLTCVCHHRPVCVWQCHHWPVCVCRTQCVLTDLCTSILSDVALCRMTVSSSSVYSRPESNCSHLTNSCSLSGTVRTMQCNAVSTRSIHIVRTLQLVPGPYTLWEHYN